MVHPRISLRSCGLLADQLRAKALETHVLPYRYL
jgi:hypothetical protein